MECVISITSIKAENKPEVTGPTEAGHHLQKVLKKNILYTTLVSPDTSGTVRYLYCFSPGN